MNKRIDKTNNSVEICPLCNKSIERLSIHFKSAHTSEELEEAVLNDKNRGMPDVEIGRKYGITYRQLEKIIRKATGVNVSTINVHKKIKRLSPKDFKEENTTVWSFKSRGNWATHSGEYRGNWSPYIPRNVILKYSKPGEIVFDFFCGAGTTAVEAKLLGRRCIAFDINKKAIDLAKRNIDFEIPPEEPLFNKQEIFEPELFVGDARNLSFLKDNSIDLICAHPPYADIIQYTENEDGDLSYLGIEDFLKEMKKVAKESYRVLKPGRQCAILIGDMRKHKHVVPLGFRLINVFLDVGFKLKELVIKRQHNCKTTGFWYENSIKYNFLLLAHEYLPIFEKPEKDLPIVKETLQGYGAVYPWNRNPRLIKEIEKLETTTVWIFPEDEFTRLYNKNIIERYRNGGIYRTINLISEPRKFTKFHNKRKKLNLLFIKSPCLDNKEISLSDIDLYLEQLKKLILEESMFIKEGGYCVIQTKDVRVGDYVEPIGKYIVDSINVDSLSLKEIVIVTTENHKEKHLSEQGNLRIVHQYLLVYKKVM